MSQPKEEGGEIDLFQRRHDGRHVGLMCNPWAGIDRAVPARSSWVVPTPCLGQAVRGGPYGHL